MLHEQQAPPPAVAAPPPSINPDDDGGRDVEVTTFRDIHPLTPDAPPPASASWDTASHRSLSSSDDQQYMTMSREFTAMVAAGATMQTGGYDGAADQLTSIGEDELEETNPLAIVPDSHPIATPARSRASGLEVVPAGPAPQPPAHLEASQVKKEEVETKVTAWQTAEVAKINNRFKREDVVINGWETEQVEKASAWLKKIEVPTTPTPSSLLPLRQFIYILLNSNHELRICVLVCSAEEAGRAARQGAGEDAERHRQGAAQGGGEAGVGGGQAGPQAGQGAGASQLHEGRRQGAHQALLLLASRLPPSLPACV